MSMKMYWWILSFVKICAVIHYWWYPLLRHWLHRLRTVQVFGLLQPCSWGLCSSGMWLHITGWLVHIVIKQYGGLIFKGWKIWIFWPLKMKPPCCLQHQTPLTQCFSATSLKSTDLFLSVALQETNVSHLDCKVLISWPLNDIVRIFLICKWDNCLQDWLTTGNNQRATATTGMNEKSSRSHSIFSIALTQTEVRSCITGFCIYHSRTTMKNITVYFILL